VVQILLASGRADANEWDEQQMTPLMHVAVGTGKVDVQARRRRRNRTPLHWMAMAAKMGLVELLLATAGVDQHYRGADGWMALALAVIGGHVDVVRVLLDVEGAGSNTRDSYRRTPLIYAASQGRLDIIELLLEGALTRNSRMTVCILLRLLLARRATTTWWLPCLPPCRISGCSIMHEP
jgi:hypothetical protein